MHVYLSKLFFVCLFYFAFSKFCEKAVKFTGNVL